MSRSQLIKVAKEEIREWKNLPPGLAMIVLFAFIHKVTTGETVEETFFKQREPVWNYEI